MEMRPPAVPNAIYYVTGEASEIDAVQESRSELELRLPGFRGTRGEAAIPLSPFCDEPVEPRLVGFCFAMVSWTLEAAAPKVRAV
jgi:hypothetical protein